MRSSLINLAGFVAIATASPVDFVRRQATNSSSSVVSSASRSATSSAASAAATATGITAPTMTNGTVPLNTTGITDVDVLQFALALEQLELSFYRVGLNYDAAAYESAGYPDWVRQRFTEIISQEQVHVNVIEQTIRGLGATPNAYCNYSFPVEDPKSFLMVAQMINDVGPGAYTGSGALIQNKTILTTASQILSVEARHNAFVRADVNKGDAFPMTFQVPLTPGQAYTLASQFITSCPANNTALVVTAKPSVNIYPAAPYYVGQTIYLKQGPTYGPAFNVGQAANTTANMTMPTAFPSSGLYAAFLNGNMPGSYPFVPLGSDGGVKIPAGTTGQSYVVVVNSNSEITDATTVAGPGIVEVPVPQMNFQVNGNPYGRVKTT